MSIHKHTHAHTRTRTYTNHIHLFSVAKALRSVLRARFVACVRTCRGTTMSSFSEYSNASAFSDSKLALYVAFLTGRSLLMSARKMLFSKYEE